MAKHKYGDIRYEELANFIEPINMNIDVPLADLSNFYGSHYSMYGDAIKYIMDIYDDLFSSMSITKNNIINRNTYRVTAITYNTHIDGYDFRINPITIFNRIFKSFGFNYEIPFINLDNEYGIPYLKDYVRSIMNDIRKNSTDITTLNIIRELTSNLDNICNAYNEDINTKIEKAAVPKDILFYLSYRSLELYENTKDERYTLLPYEYYHNISHMQNSPYPHMINISKYDNKVWFTNYRYDYENIIGKDYIPNSYKYLLKKDEVLIAWDILKPGMVDREIRDTIEKHRANPNVDYAKYQRLFELKMKYYMNSPYRSNIIGKYGLLGYMGFSYDNDYLVFDKFHNSETMNPTKKTILTHGEAIYALPADRFNLVKGTKQGIIKEKNADDRIKKINHTTNESFIGRLDNVIYGPNLSTKSFDEVLEEEKKKVLIRKF